MTNLSDRDYLRGEQYRDPRNLNARIALHLLFSTNTYGWQRWVFDQLDLGESSRILEIGCGPGALWAENSARVPPGWQVTLLDFSPGMVTAARLALGARPAFRFLAGDAQALPFPAGQFDAVIANHMLYHVPDRPGALHEIRRVLRPAGRLYAATNGVRHLQEIDHLLDRFDPDVPYWRAAPASGAPGPRSPSGFDLEHGAAELGAWFPSVELRRYPDALVLTEVAPLLAYILSTSTGGALSPERVVALRAFLDAELASQGAISITKDSGLFLAAAG